MGTLADLPGLLRTRIDDGVATLTFDDIASNNALSHGMVIALGDAFGVVASRTDVRAVVLAGSSEYFSSGADRGVVSDLVTGRRDAGELLLPRLLLDCPVPVIAALAGHAVGGGFALGMAADFIVLARESRYCLNFMDLGFTPGMGSTRLLEHVLSPAIAHELLFTGEARRGRDFDGKCGINHIVPRADVLACAQTIAMRIADKPRPAIVALKRALSLPRRQAFEAARTHETMMHQLSFAQPDAANRILNSLNDNTEH
ncbi:MAG TPA: polyketide synthase [Kofleriaceae bacterium]|jgi:polyketide biosynthesis enoyl-CoA hydratase PksI